MLTACSASTKSGRPFLADAPNSGAILSTDVNIDWDFYAGPTYKFIQDQLGPDHDKTIVLTGALRPAVQSDTDAFFNLGFALATCFTAPPGVYIAMHGIHDPRHCRKTETGIFMPSYH